MTNPGRIIVFIAVGMLAGWAAGEIIKALLGGH